MAGDLNVRHSRNICYFFNLTGDPGFPGVKGLKGSKGGFGETGPKGLKGMSGNPGLTGKLFPRSDYVAKHVYFNIV